MSLTQMRNRRAGKAMMETALNAAREGKRQMAVVLLDINELKRINDLYGHSEGDRLLQYVSAVLQPRLRTGRPDVPAQRGRVRADSLR